MALMKFLVLIIAHLGLVYGDAWRDPNCAENRVAMVHLFEWKWNDIADECERFLGPMGFCGVQVSPPAENAVIVPPGNPFRPWWERYQPVSYRLETRSGTEEQFQDMIRRCHNVGVRIYVDLIINHMTGMGRAGLGTGGTEFDADAGHFPGVPYTMDNFNDCSDCSHCCCIDDWVDRKRVRNCRLVGLIDLNPKIPDTFNKIVAYMNKLIRYGIAGFRVDTGKHMWPEDLENIWNALEDLNTQWFPAGTKPFVGLEVIDMNQNGEIRAQEYTHLGRVTEFRFSVKVNEATGSLWDIPGMYDPGWGMISSEEAFVFVDNHDTQRGHGSGGSNIITYKRPREYKMAQAITFGWNYGFPRMMSSFAFEDSEVGPPHNPDGSIKDVIINPDGSCGNGWVCEHRWKAIAGMASFSKAVKGTDVGGWWISGNQAAWRRGFKGFIALTNQPPLDELMATGLPAGDYCNVIQGCPTSSGCEGETITVDSSGNARIKITNGDEPILAIHIEARAGSNGCIEGGGPIGTVTAGPSTARTESTTGEPSPTRPPVSISSTTEMSTGQSTTPPLPTSPTPAPPGSQRTVILLARQTAVGQDIFLRGGISHERRPGCWDNPETSPCAISIKHNSLGTSPHYDGYNSWSVGDTKLDWSGAQDGQGSYNGRSAEGTPTAWTTNDVNHPGFQPINRFGPHQWMVDLQMNCDETEDGWFEFKAFGTGIGWENDINQISSCGGPVGGSMPYATNNHMARCGYLNMFSWGDGNCVIDWVEYDN